MQINFKKKVNTDLCWHSKLLSVFHFCGCFHILCITSVPVEHSPVWRWEDCAYLWSTLQCGGEKIVQHGHLLALVDKVVKLGRILTLLVRLQEKQDAFVNKDWDIKTANKLHYCINNKLMKGKALRKHSLHIFDVFQILRVLKTTSEI